MDQLHLDSNDSKCRQAILSSALAIAIIAGLTYPVALIIRHFFPSAPSSDLAELTEIVASFLIPEPTERRTFQVMLLLTPIIALLSHVIIKKLSPSIYFFGNRAYVIVAVLTLLWVNSWALWPNYMSYCGLGSFTLVFPIVTILLLLIYTYNHFAPFRWIDALIRKKFTLVSTMLLGTCFFIACSFRIFDWKFLLNNGNSSIIHHLNPILYYASLAERGNFTTNLGAPQYGFYSLYLKPVFNMLGLTIYSFSFIMTLLYLAGVIAIALPIYRHLKNPYLKLLLVPVLCALQGALGQTSHTWMLYFQYFPVRLLVPALSVLMLYLILRTKKNNIRLWRAASSSFLLGFLVLWNFDSGITTIIAWVGFFILIAAVQAVKHRTLLNHESILFYIVLSTLALGVGLASIILITCDKSGISFDRLFERQKVFYLNGFGMLPIPLILHPWMAVLGVYVATLVFTLPIILHSGLQSSPKRMIAFYISILGLGLFSYYQGRSHDMNLPTVAWPAVLCCFLACDWCLSADSAKQRFAIRFLTLPFMIIAVSLTMKIALNSPWYFKRITALRQELATTELNPITMSASYTIDCLSKYRNEPPNSVLIISSDESIYYFESGLHPLPLLPSEQERFIFRRQETDMQKIIQGGTIRHLFISQTLLQKKEYERIYETIHSMYKMEETTLLEHWTLKEAPVKD